MDRRTEDEKDEILLKFLEKIAHWDQTAASKLLGIDRRRFNDYYNHRRKTPERCLVKMECLLRARGIRLKKEEEALQHQEILDLPILERTAYLVQLEKSAGERRGRPSPSEDDKKLEKCHLSDALNIKKGRTDSYLAKHYGYGNRKRYWYAKQVLLKGSDALKQAVNENRLDIEEAYYLLSRPQAEQQAVLRKSADEMAAYFKAVRPKLIDLQRILRLIQQSALLRQAEEKLQLPLRENLMEEILAGLNR